MSRQNKKNNSLSIINSSESNKQKSYQKEQTYEYIPIREDNFYPTRKQVSNQVPRGGAIYSYQRPIYQVYSFPQVPRAQTSTRHPQLPSQRNPPTIISNQRIRDKSQSGETAVRAKRYNFLFNLNPGAYSTPLTDHILNELRSKKIPSKKQVCEGILHYSQAINEEDAGKIFMDHLNKSNNELEFNNQCIYIYTMETYLYRHVNNQLRKKQQIKNMFRPLIPYCIRMANIVLQNEDYSGTVFRGVQKSEQQLKQLLEQYVVGKTVTWHAFSSASKMRKVGEDFSKGAALFEIELDGRRGYDITELSSHKNEGQVLLGVNTTFEVLKKQGKYVKMRSIKS